MASEGLKVTEIIDNGKNTKNDIGITKTLQYKDLDKNEIMKIWKKFSGVSIFGVYKSECWHILSKHKDVHTYVKFLFDNETNNILKSFLLIRLNNEMDCEAEATRLSTLIHFLEYTDCFSDEYIDDLDDINEDVFFSQMQVVEVLLFMDFSGLGNIKYENILRSLKFENKIRKIPSFVSVLIIDKIMTDFIKNASDEETNFYGIVILWWELTKVIPVRPIEYFKLSIDCLLQENGHYYILIERAKKSKHSRNEVELLPRLQINKYIFELFNNYININRECMVDNEYIFNADLYRKINVKSSLKRDGFTGRTILYHLFQKFYDETVSKKYGYIVVEKEDFIELESNEVERIQCGDTRHLAFLNMLLQGYSPYTIAQLGGHTTINQQNTYYCHLEPFVSSKAYCLCRSILNGFDTIGFGYGARVLIKNSTIQKEILGDKLQSLRKLPYGYCTSDNFPYECEFDDCVFCPRCILDNKASVYIAAHKEKMLNELNTHVTYLQKILNSPGENKQGNEERQTIINKINSDTGKLAMIYAREHEMNNI